MPLLCGSRYSPRMAKAIRKAWGRCTIEVALFGGLFAVPLTVHTLARILA